MKLTCTVVVGACLLTASCGIMDCYRPAERMRVRVVGAPTVSYNLAMGQGNPVRVEKMQDGTFKLNIPPERYGGMLIVVIPYVKDPEREWKVNVVRGDSVVLVTTISRIRKLKEIDGIRILIVKDD